jgi:hypothetical protein
VSVSESGLAYQRNADVSNFQITFAFQNWVPFSGGNSSRSGIQQPIGISYRRETSASCLISAKLPAMHDLIVKESRTKYSKCPGIRSFTGVRPVRRPKGGRVILVIVKVVRNVLGIDVCTIPTRAI